MDYVYFRPRIISDYMCGDIDGLYGHIVQDAVSALRYVIAVVLAVV